MREPDNFFLNPYQQSEVRRDQYFPATPPLGGSEWGSSFTDYRGNSLAMGAMETQYLCRVFADEDGNIQDSNNYYRVYKIDQWFGVGDLDLLCEMRLDSSEDLEEGDEVLTILSGISMDSPDEDDDGFFLCKEILFNTPPLKPFHVTLTDRDTGSIDLCDEETDCYQYAWSNCDTVGGTLPAEILLGREQTADGLNPTIYTMMLVGFTGGTYTLTEDGGSPTSDIDYNADAATIEGLLSEFTVTGTYPDFTLTGVDSSDHTITADTTNSKPKNAHSPAVFLNCDTPMCYPVDVYLQLRSGQNPRVSIYVSQDAEPGPDPPPSAGFSLVAHGSGAATTSAIDSSGSNLIVIFAAGFGSLGSFSDSMGNTWTPLTGQGGGSRNGQLAYCVNPTVGAGHTFSNSGAFMGVCAAAFSGASATPFDSESGSAGVAQPGSITPAGDNEILICGLSTSDSGTQAIDSGFTISDQRGEVGGVSVGAGLAYLIQTSGSAVNPSWTPASNARVVMAAFKSA